MALTPDELPAYLEELMVRVNDPAGRAASNGMVRTFDKGIKSEELVHFSGSPSPPGQPPALESGRLRDSFRITPAVPEGDYRWRSSDAPTVIYARIQEYGGDIYPRVKLWLHWVDGEGDHFAKHVRLPARPYIRPAVRRMTYNGELSRGASDAFSAEMWG